MSSIDSLVLKSGDYNADLISDQDFGAEIARLEAELEELQQWMDTWGHGITNGAYHTPKGLFINGFNSFHMFINIMMFVIIIGGAIDIFVR